MWGRLSSSLTKRLNVLGCQTVEKFPSKFKGFKNRRCFASELNALLLLDINRGAAVPLILPN